MEGDGTVAIGLPHAAGMSVCDRPCPPLRGFVAEDAELHAMGPADDADALVPAERRR